MVVQSWGPKCENTYNRVNIGRCVRSSPRRAPTMVQAVLMVATALIKITLKVFAMTLTSSGLAGMKQDILGGR